MITVAEALDKLLALAAPLEVEQVPLRGAAGRTLARPVAARRDQPP
ncbi:MAG: molybdopterin molybdenumtransferase MoeA, partial [Alphaproteobacteria bacterium]|nr:molybdopterin molybdenumtransferase MoeA [Alphaproteobacteria bacterium]